MDDARERTDDLFRLVRPEALHDRPIPERHRILFYIGHLEAFDWNLIGGHVLGLESPHAALDRLFAFGIDPVGGHLPTDRPEDWPRLDEVHGYAKRTRSAIDAALAAPAAPGTPLLDDGAALNVAIEHRLMHAETLAYMLHQLAFDRKRIDAIAAPAAAAVSPEPKSMIEIPAGTALLGLRRDSGIFGWDNEYEAHQVDVPAFAIDAAKVTNGEFLEFVTSGGYEEAALWSESDRAWIRDSARKHPSFWVARGGSFSYRAMGGEVPLPLAAPVYVSHAEAAAYARWCGKRLPTEAQWHRATFGTPEGAERPYPWGADSPSSRFGNFDFHSWDPLPAASFAAGASAWGVRDLVGNGWEWTRTVFGPWPGFTPFAFYPGYSADFFDDKHFVMKGGSPRTAACLLRRSFRNWFQAHYGFAYAGFRCVED